MGKHTDPRIATSTEALTEAATETRTGSSTGQLGSGLASGTETTGRAEVDHAARQQAGGEARDPERVASLLDLLVGKDVDHALGHIEDLVARVRAEADEAAAAREVVRNTPPDVLREALRLRSVRAEHPSTARARVPDVAGVAVSGRGLRGLTEPRP